MPVTVRHDYALADSLAASGGRIFLTGTQALIRLPLMQAARDRAAGLATQGFVSGYRGSPLGMVDQAAWKAKKLLDAAGVRFLPAVNEELGATAVLGTQRVESDPERTADGVFALWYGKGPGVDRAADALKHGNAYGASPNGGVLVVAGDDHGCVSSSMPHQSDLTMAAWSMPVVAPASVAEYLEFGLWGWAASRFSGAWVGFTALSEVVESGCTVDLDAVAARTAAWANADTVRAVTGFRPPADGLHYRWPDLPSLAIEQRLFAKLDAVRAFAQVNPLDRDVVLAPQATLGILTCGKAHYDLMEVFRRLGITPEALADAGVRVRKIGLAFPLEPLAADRFAEGLDEVLVVEEKAPFVETQLRDRFYNRAVRPRIVGKLDAEGRPMLSAGGELRPSRLIERVADWLARHRPALDRRERVVDFTAPQLLSNDSDRVKRVPYFCAGCPHNTSTVVPEGSRAQAGIGCHFMASWMNRETEGLIQMGGEGVDWVSHAMFTKVPHIFQNLGDGTYYHSGYLAIRQAVAAKATLTYKILFNDAVAMTGGQPVDGPTSPQAIAQQVKAEGAARVVVLSDDIAKYRGREAEFPAGTTFHDRAALDAVQRELRATPGVTVMIYEQTCAAEKRRRRKKGELAVPARKLFINSAVCEGCGDCGVQSNCVAVLPHETPLGRKRRIDQSACNRDESCAKGFCPSFVGVVGGQPRKRAGALADGDARFAAAIAALPVPAEKHWAGPYDLLVTGVGGTGVVTVGALVSMAAHLEDKSASVLDFMGFAQKGGSVLSFVRLAEDAAALNQVRIDVQQADAVLGCDIVVAASPDALQTIRHGRTQVLVNLHEIPVAESVSNPDADLRLPQLLDKLRFAAGADRVRTLDAQALADEFLGDSIYSNIVALGHAWQLGLVPVSLAAMERAIELNGVAVKANLAAFSLGRLHAHDAAACAALLQAPAETPAADEAPEPLDALVARLAAHVQAWGGARWAARFTALVAAVRESEAALGGEPALARTVAQAFAKLIAYKDEYEVARLYTNGAFERELRAQFEGDFRLEFFMAPPLLGAAKRRFGAWLLPALRVLAKARGLRGSVLDPFGHTAERRMERALVDHYEATVRAWLPLLAADTRALCREIAALPLSMRGFGHVKQRNVEAARSREAHLLHRLDPARWPKPAEAPRGGQFRGIPVVSR